MLTAVYRCLVEYFVSMQAMDTASFQSLLETVRPFNLKSKAALFETLSYLKTS